MIAGCHGPGRRGKPGLQANSIHYRSVEIERHPESVQAIG